MPNPNTTEPALDVMRTQAGDTVCVVDDEHQFSFGELNCGHYRIIDVPGVLQADLIDLIESVFDTDESTMLRLRKWTIPMTVLNSGQWKNKTIATKTQIDAIKVLRT